MFTKLHQLAADHTLLLTVAAEGELLRINIAPVAADTKKKPGVQPLSLLATPEELDADFAAALDLWQRPKRSVLQQAQEAAGAAPSAGSADEEDDDDEADGKPPTGKADKRAASKKPATKTPGKADKKDAAKADKPAATEQWPFPTQADAKQAAAGPAGDVTEQADDGGGKAEEEPTAESAAAAADADTTQAEGTPSAAGDSFALDIF